jgi:hypothetical protein
MLVNTVPPICRNLGGSLRSPALDDNLTLCVEYAHPEQMVGCGLQNICDDRRERVRIGYVGAPGRYGQRTRLSFGFSFRLSRNKNRVSVQVRSHTLETED